MLGYELIDASNGKAVCEGLLNCVRFMEKIMRKGDSGFDYTLLVVNSSYREIARYEDDSAKHFLLDIRNVVEYCGGMVGHWEQSSGMIGE